MSKDDRNFLAKSIFWEHFPSDKSSFVLVSDPVDQGVRLCTPSAKSPPYALFVHTPSLLSLSILMFSSALTGNAFSVRMVRPKA